MAFGGESAMQKGIELATMCSFGYYDRDSADAPGDLLNQL
jgi:hypothetical protein